MANPRKAKAHVASRRRKADKHRPIERRNKRDRAYKRAKANVKTTRRAWKNRGKGRG